MTTAWAILLLSLAVILLGCDLFTNAVEWAGRRLRIAEGAVGSILAAVGTCLPETLVAILATVFGAKSGAGDEIGIGAILGAPLMLSTLAFFVTGAAVLVFSLTRRRTTEMNASHSVIGRDLRYFFLVFGVSGLAGLIRVPLVHYLVAAGLVALYGLYVARTFADHRGPSDEADEELAPLRLFRSHASPGLAVIVVQLVAGLAALVVGAHYFVEQLTVVGHAVGVPLLVLSLVLTPIATELPEKMNSVLWVRNRKDTLALGNISGAMVFQSSVPTAIGLIFTDWELTPQALACIFVALGSTGAVAGEMMWRKRISAYSLLVGGLFYAAYLAWIFRPT
jgi:cation:H+ antiporter